MNRNFLPVKSSEDRPASPSRQIQWREAFVSHWKLSCIAFVLILIIGLPLAWFQGRPLWRAEGVLFVSPRVLRNLDTDPEQELQSNSQYREFVQQQVRTITRFDIVEAALGKDSGLWAKWHKPNENSRRAIDRLRGSLEIAPVADTYQVTVALEGAKADGLSEIVNAVMKSYVDVAHKELLYDGEERVKHLQDEKRKLAATIDQHMLERGRIAQQLGTTVFSSALVNSYDKMLGEASGALMDARRQKAVAEASIRTGDTEVSALTGISAEALEKALGDAGVNGLKSVLNQRKAELLVKIQGLSPQHSSRISAENEIEQIDREIERITRQMQDRLARNIEMVRKARLAQASQVEEKLHQETSELRAQAEEYSRAYQHSIEIGEEIERSRKRLNAVEDRIAYLELETNAPGFVRVFAPALPADLPVKGGRRKLLLLTALVACLLALCIPIGLDYFDPSVRSASELETQVGLPLSAVIPESQESLSRGALLRAAVSIRRHLQELSHRAVVVTGLRSGAGTSTVALQLGTTLNKIGVRTVVLEANALTPDSRYSASATPGLIEVIRRQADLSKAIVLGSNELPDRVATGHGMEDELLATDRIGDVVRALRKDYDLILVDVAPVESSLASEELVRTLNAVLLIVNARGDDRNALAACMSRLERLAPQTFGAILNRASDKASTNRELLLHDHSPLLAA